MDYGKNITVAYASNEACVVVEQMDGSRVGYLLSELPRITCSDDVMRLTTSETSLELDANDICKIYLSTTSETSVAVAADITIPTLRVSIVGDECMVSGLLPEERVTFCDVSGMLFVSDVAKDDGTLSVSLGSMSCSVVIVKTERWSFKFIKR